jgi:phosphatidate cytidylyltransferase
MGEDADGEHARASKTAKSMSDLKPRLIAGAVMAAVALALAYAGPKPFALLVIAVALIMCWEWGRVVRGEEFGLAFVVHAGTIIFAGVLAAVGLPALGGVAVAIGGIILLVMPLGPRQAMSAAGVAYVGFPTVAMLWFRADVPLGFVAILFIFAIGWGSDIGAFVAGRTIGGPKLWPRVSPNKTWAGFLGALAAGLVSGLIFAQVVSGASSLVLGTNGVLLAFVAQMGDLAESALKRQFGIKDSSAIIPGHGGVMDRADSTVAVSVAVSILALLVNPASPARALFGV